MSLNEKRVRGVRFDKKARKWYAAYARGGPAKWVRHEWLGYFASKASAVRALRRAVAKDPPKRNFGPCPGVHMNRKTGKWRAAYQDRLTRFYVGEFADFREAAEALAEHKKRKG